MPGSRGRKLATGAAVFAVSVLVTLLALEVAFRLRSMFLHEAIRVPEEIWIEYDPILGWRHIQNKTVPRAFGPIPVVTDAHGYRIDPTAATQAPGAPSAAPARPKRTLFAVGDSFTFGHKIAGGDSWPLSLGRRIADRGWAVVNMGVSAYGFDQMYLSVREAQDRIQPGDLVVAAVIYHDIRRVTMRRWVSGYGRPRFVLKSGALVLTNVPTPRRVDPRTVDWDVFLDRHASYLWEFVEDRLGWLDTVRTEEGVRISAAILDAFRVLVERRGARFALVLLPVKPFPHAGQELAIDRFARAIAGGRARVIDGRTQIDTTEPGYHLSPDLHPSAIGHARIAEAILRGLDAEGMLEPDSTAPGNAAVGPPGGGASYSPMIAPSRRSRKERHPTPPASSAFPFPPRG